MNFKFDQCEIIYEWVRNKEFSLKHVIWSVCYRRARVLEIRSTKTENETTEEWKSFDESLTTRDWLNSHSNWSSWLALDPWRNVYIVVNCLHFVFFFYVFYFPITFCHILHSTKKITFGCNYFFFKLKSYLYRIFLRKTFD